MRRPVRRHGPAQGPQGLLDVAGGGHFVGHKGLGSRQGLVNRLLPGKGGREFLGHRVRYEDPRALTK